MNYNFWTMIGTWISGIGIIFAAFVSLHLAGRSNRVLIKLGCSLHFHRFSHDLIIGHSNITVYNIGTMPVTITDWGIETNSFRILSFLLKAEDMKLPYTVNPEQSTSLGLQAHEFIQILRDHQDILSGGCIKFYVSTAVGEKYHVRSEETYEEILMKFDE